MIEKSVVDLAVEKVVPNPYQPRKIFNEEQLHELSESIRSYGILQPITVRVIEDDRYELVAGERRLRAARIAGLKTIPAIINNMNEESSAVLAIIENLQREDLNFIEESAGYFRLIENYNFTQKELAEKIGKSQSTIANKLRILKLPQSVKDLITQNQLTERHARALLKLPSEEYMIDVLNKVIKRELNVKKTEEIIAIILDELNKPQEPQKKRKIKASVNMRIYLNTLKNAYQAISDTGVEANYKEIDMGDHIEVTVKIPKTQK